MYGRTDVHDEQRSGRRSVSVETIVKVKQEMLEILRMTIPELCERIPEPAHRGGRILMTRVEEV